MTPGDADGLPLLPEHDGEEVLVLIDEFGVLVRGPHDVASRAIELLLEPLGESSKRNDPAMVHGACFGSHHGGGHRSTGRAVLPAAPGASRQAQGPRPAARRKHLRGCLRNQRGHFAGDLSFEPVSPRHCHLQEVVEATNERGHLLDADWQSVAGTRNQLQRDLETLRDYVRSEAGKVTDK